MKTVRCLIVVFASVSSLLYSLSTFAAGEGMQSVTLDGVLYSDTNFTNPLLDSAVTFDIKILDQTKTCVLYQETQVANTLTTSGRYNLQIGSAVGALKRNGDDPGRSMIEVFQNVTPIAVTNAGCSGGANYNPSSGHVRYLEVTVTPSSTGVPNTVSPDMMLTSVPNALVCESVQGLDRDKLAEFGAHINAAMTAANLLKLFDGSDADTLHNHDGAYAKLNSSNSITMGSGQTVGFGQFTNVEEAALTAGLNTTTDVGKTWVNSNTGKVMYWDGTSAVDLSAGGGGAVTSVFGRTGTVVAVAGDYNAGQITNTAAGNISATDVQAAITELDNEKLALAGGTMAGTLDMNGSQIDMGAAKIIDVADPTSAQDAATKAYVDSTVSTAGGSFVAKAGDSMTGALAMGTNKITGLGDPTLAQDASTKNYTDGRLLGNTLAAPGGGQVSQSIRWNAGGTAWEYYTPSSGGISDIVSDTTPQLGGTLDINGQNMSTASGFNIDITGSSSGNDFTVDTDKLVVEGDTGNVGVGTATPDSSALVDISSTTKGFLPPRMTTAERDAVSSPATGLTVYNSSTNKLNVYDGSSWVEVGSGGGSSGYTQIGSTQTISSGVNEVVFSSISSTYEHIYILIEGMSCSGNDGQGEVSLSSDNGSTYYTNHIASGEVEQSSTTSHGADRWDDGVKIGKDIDSAEANSGYVKISSYKSGFFPQVITHASDSNERRFMQGTLDAVLTADMNAVKIWCSTSQVDAGTFKLYGYSGSGGGSADDLGNHTASQNITLGSNYLSGDGDSEGLQVDSSGNVSLSQNLTLTGTVDMSSATITDNSISVDDLNFASTNGVNIPQLASDPGSPTAGQMYYNTSTNKMMIYNGSSFVEVGSGSGGGVTVITCSKTFSGAQIVYNGSFSAGDCGGTIPDSSYIGVLTKTEGGTIGPAYKYVHFDISSAPPAYSFRFPSNLTGSAEFIVKYFKIVGSGSSSLVDADNDTQIQVEESTDEDIIRFDTAGAERMVINASGNVGIGTASPSEKLEVAGNIKASEISGPWDNSASGYIRLGDVQIIWGSYASNASGAIATTSFPVAFLDTSYSLTLTPLYNSTSLARFSQVVTKATGSFEAQTMNTSNQRSDVDGSYIAIGRWR